MRIGSPKETYAADEALFRTRTQWAWFGVLLAALAGFPFVANLYWLYLVCLVSINVIAVTGLNVLTGYTGQVSLGQAAFMGVGAYTVAWLENHTGSPFPVNLLAGSVVATGVGLIAGLPSLRVKGLYLAIATIAASFILLFIFKNWESVTNGTRGIGIEPPSAFGVALENPDTFYWLVVPVTVVMLLLASNLFRTRIGRAFIAIRDRDISASVLGIDLPRYKLMSFGISAFYAGMAGGLYAYFFGSINPESFPLLMSIFLLAAVIVGGMGSMLGSILGGIFMTLVPELLRYGIDFLGLFMENASAVLSPVRTVVFGLLIVGFLLFEPLGLAEIWRRIRRFFHLWPFRT
ncbi:branched-chain amino acid ABC transporter permease [Ectothiorhodospiraceae bacterium WFHF3C12]|nr:branched-chain amino acid ABC transporter permease [Ectothiorhodospiraceae bacterium WFHF3C12]